ncbi:ABC transporter substrate-binding protein [Agromyces atrinae]|nr:extracellular solute-binding protein [Agromyces atrinae]NYD67435.1 multiple sugar transport system substrate-binding protein [Agromyces atrinae]
MSATKRWLAGSVAAIAAVGLAGCSAGDGGGGTADEPTVVEFWGWNQGQDLMVDAFNEANETVQLTYTQFPSQADLLTGLSNAVTAGTDVPCLVQAPGSPVSLLSKGLIQPITEQFAGNEDAFIETAVTSQSANDEILGVPFSGGPGFAMINKAVYDANGLEAPTTWDELIETGKTLKDQGVSVLNFAGEDPSTLVSFSNQAGATWFEIDGDSWVVDIDSPETQKAADVLQQFIDNDLITHETFADIPAMSQTYDAGKMVTIPLTTWNLAAWQERLSTSLGSWQTIDLPQFADADEFVVPGSFGGYSVPEGCESVDAAVDAAVFLATDPTTVGIAASPSEGAGNYPAIPDAGEYVDGLLPPTLLGDTVGETPAVIERAANAARVQWIDSPSATYFDELVSQWAKAVNKEITLREAVTHMQDYVVSDLEAQGIDVTER